MPDIRAMARWSVPAIALAIAWLSLEPGAVDPDGGFALLRAIAAALLGDASQQDKIGHFIAYSTLSAFAVFGFVRRPWRLVVIVCVLYGGLFELLQASLPGRYPSLADLLANSLGCLTGCALALLAGRVLKGFQA